MPTRKLSFQTNEVTAKGKNVILTGDLQHKNRCTQPVPVPADWSLASLLSGLVGAPLGKQVEARLAGVDERRCLQPERGAFLILRELLEYERYRNERWCTYARFEREEEKRDARNLIPQNPFGESALDWLRLLGGYYFRNRRR
jgi:hypothetical protein